MLPKEVCWKVTLPHKRCYLGYCLWRRLFSISYPVKNDPCPRSLLGLRILTWLLRMPYKISTHNRMIGHLSTSVPCGSLNITRPEKNKWGEDGERMTIERDKNKKAATLKSFNLLILFGAWGRSRTGTKLCFEGF
jgi:hypothetical protein